jgi:hypothetical protein
MAGVVAVAAAIVAGVAADDHSMDLPSTARKQEAREQN